MNEYGNEMFNFKPFKGRVYGIVPGMSSIRIERLDPPDSARPVGSATLRKNVDVVWTAKANGVGSRVVVGWYRDALVHRRLQRQIADHVSLSPYPIDFFIEAASRDTVLLPPNERTFRVPTAHELQKAQGPAYRVGSGPGQRCVFYPDRNPALQSALRLLMDARSP